MDYLTIPVIYLNGPGLYPGLSTTLYLKNGPEFSEIIRCVRKKENQIAIFNSRDWGLDKNAILPIDTKVYSFGVLAEIVRIVGTDNDKVMQLHIAITERVELLTGRNGLYGNIHVWPFEESLDVDREREQAFKEILRENYLEYLELCREVDRKLPEIRFKEDPFNMSFPLTVLLGQVMASLEYSPEDSYSFLATESLEGRYYIAADKLRSAVEVKRIKKSISAQVKVNLQEKQKQAILNEEMNVIKKQMNDGDDPAAEYRKKTEKLDAPEAVKEKLNKEINRLERMPMGGAESSVLTNYIENVLDFPWNKMSEEKNNIENAREILDEDHYGLDKVKERILEYLAVRNLSKEPVGTILCLAGPPGTGKTSIVRSIARALGREYVRISLGGVHDEAEIRGHRKTYIGAMPGRVVAAIKKCGTSNPVILLDELDKMGKDGVHGSPADAMLEVLDSEQNSTFRDHFMELPIDLSKVIFVATANDKSNIPEALYDRLDIIDIDSYTAPEKQHIADKYLIEKQMRKNGISSDELKICENVIETIISDYTKEAGVRQLERRIAAICRKTALKVLEGKETGIKVTVDDLESLLGRPYHKRDADRHENQVGVVHGLAWTSVGGVVLDVEASAMPGKGELVLTGQMGDVMKESARIALSLVRNRTQGIVPEDYFDTHSFHIHIPEGATPKDGPSAGITLSTVLYSIATGKKVRGDVAMTGEVTLTGRVLAIGGLREKLLAANTEGYTHAIAPIANTRDVAELSEEILGNMEIHYASKIEDVWSLVFMEEE